MNQTAPLISDHSTKAMPLIVLSLLGAPALLPNSANGAEALSLPPMIVTGEKIDKHIKDTNTAVTLFSGDQMQSGENNLAKEIVTQAPNVLTDSFGNVSIRGMSGGGAATGGAALITGSRARVTTVIDGSIQDWSGYNFTPNDLWDVEQVEVLRGPQSTAQGPSAIAGAIVITTNDPSFREEAAIRAGLERYENGNLKPNLAAMVSGPLIDNVLAYRLAVDGNKGEGWLNYETGNHDVPNLSKSESLNLRGKLLWLPAGMPDLTAKLTVNHHKNKGEHASFASNTDEGIRTRTLDINTAVARLQDSTENAAALDLNYTLADSLTNDFHLSHAHSDIHADGYRADSVFNYNIEQKSTALENRIVFEQAESDLTGFIGLFASQKQSDIFSTQGPVMIDTDYTTDITALFGEGIYALGVATKATLGLRVENEKIDKTGALMNSGPLDQDSDKTYFLPKLALMHEISSSTTLGFSILEGYSPGGTGITFDGDVYRYDSEEVRSYELSSKSDFGGGATLHANLFYNRYDDYQALSGLTLYNVEKSRIYGTELEATAWPTDNLEVRGSIGILESKIEKHNDYKGNELSSVPETNIRLGLTQYIGNEWSVGADLSYVGEYYSDLSNADTTEVGDALIADLRAQYHMAAFTVDAYIKNVTNEEAVYYRAGSLATVGQTRTLGLSMTYRM